jgi:hypothetical protein
MSIEKLVRMSGIAALLCGLATVLFWFLHPSAADPQAPHDAAFFAAVQEPRFQAVFLLFTALILLSLLALAGYYVRLRESAGTFGLVAFLISFFATAMFVASGVFQAAVAPALAANAVTQQLLRPDGPLLTGLLGALFAGTGLSFAAGYLLLGIVMLRTRVFPRGAALLLMLGAPVLGLSPLMPLWARIVGCVCWGSGNIWLGYLQLTVGSTAIHLGKGSPHGLEQAV